MGSAHLILIPAESESLLVKEDEEKSGDSRILAFEGKPESLKFVTFSDKLMTEGSSPWMHEVRFYLQENKETGRQDFLMNERDFYQKDFFKQDSPGLDKGQTLRLAQDVVYLKFRYYQESPENEAILDSSGDKSVKSSGQWTDKIITEPIDFNSNTASNENTDITTEPIIFPRAVEVSVGLLKPGLPEEAVEQSIIELPPTIITIQMGRVFARFVEEEGGSDASAE